MFGPVMRNYTDFNDHIFTLNVYIFLLLGFSWNI